MQMTNLPNRIFLPLLVVICMSCRQQTSCSMDELFCHPESEWSARASTMSTQRVYQAHVADYEFHRPQLDAVLPVLGSRGEEAARVLVSDLENNRDHLEYGFYQPIIFSIVNESGFDFCRSEYHRRLVSILRAGEQSDGAPPARNGEVARLAGFCNSDIGQP